MATPTPKASYERVDVGGRQYLVCVDCRYPLLPGAPNPVHPVPVPGNPSPDATKQAVCADCYVKGWNRVYPDTPPPQFKSDFRMPGSEPIPWDRAKAQDAPQDEYSIWEVALEQARASGGAEKVEQAYRRLTSKPDVEMTEAPPDEPTTRAVE